MFDLRGKLGTVLASGSAASPRPVLRRGNESNVKGLFVIGDLAGAPVIKLAMAQGVEVIDYIASLPEMAQRGSDDVYDVIVVGAGAAGLNAALAAKDKGLRHLVLEKGAIANTIEEFPEGKWVYAEPDATPPKGKLWLDGATKEDLVARWTQIITDNDLDIRTEEPLTSLDRQRDGTFVVKTGKDEYRARERSCWLPGSVGIHASSASPARTSSRSTTACTRRGGTTTRTSSSWAAATARWRRR